MKTKKQLKLASLVIAGGLVLGSIANTEIPFFAKGFILLIPLQVLALGYIFWNQPNLLTKK